MTPKGDLPDNVLVLVTSPPVVLDPPAATRCQHDRGAKVNGKARTVACVDCGAALDPVDYLYQLGERWGATVLWTQCLRREKDELSAEVEKLKAERNRLRSSVKGLRRRRGGS